MRRMNVTAIGVILAALVFPLGCSSSNHSVADQPDDSREVRDLKHELANAHDKIASLEHENSQLHDEVKQKEKEIKRLKKADEGDGVNVRVKW